MAEDWLEVYQNRADRLSNNPRLNEISILTFSQFHFKIKRNQLEIVVKATYGLHLNKYFEMLHLKFWGRNLVTSCFGLHSYSRGAVEIKGLPISIGFRNKNTGLLLLFSVISPCSDFGKRILARNKNTNVATHVNIFFPWRTTPIP